MKNKIWLVVKILILVFIVVWIGMLVMDYFNAKNNKNMQFCMSESVYIYENGKNTDFMEPWLEIHARIFPGRGGRGF